MSKQKLRLGIRKSLREWDYGEEIEAMFKNLGKFSLKSLLEIKKDLQELRK